MAGGFGTRLRPLTDNCPKPLLKVGDKPILEIVLDSFIKAGFVNFYISTHYMPEMIREHFGAEHVTAVDLDPEMVSAAKARWQSSAHGLEQLDFSVADATALPFKDAQFDIVFNFAVFHHIPDWQSAIVEVARVLKPNGYFVIEDLYRAAICNPLSRRLFEHPQQNRFDHQQLLHMLRQAGFKIVCDRNLFNLSGMVLAQKGFA